jgi:chemotaxis-related protein WspD
MTELTLAPLPARDDCWNRIGVWGDRSCPELTPVIHCHNCPVFARNGRLFLDAPSPPGYLEEWTERLAAPLDDDHVDLVSLLTFRLGAEWLALPVAVMVEAAEPRPIRRVPGHGGLLAGLVNVRGELHLCVRLGRLLGLPSDDAAEAGRARLLVVRREAERWAFLADEVDQVYRAPAHEIVAAPPTVGRASRRLTRGVFNWRGRAVGCLDDERLFDALRAGLR